MACEKSKKRFVTKRFEVIGILSEWEKKGWKGESTNIKEEEKTNISYLCVPSLGHTEKNPLDVLERGRSLVLHVVVLLVVVLLMFLILVLLLGILLDGALLLDLDLLILMVLLVPDIVVSSVLVLVLSLALVL